MLHVLLIEDNSADARIVREAIEASLVTVDVVIAHDGEHALRVLTEFEFTPDVIFLDLNLPKCDGFQVLERSSPNEGSSVIVLTSSTNPADIKRAQELGAREYIIKSLDLDSFVEAIRGALERWTRDAAKRLV